MTSVQNLPPLKEVVSHYGLQTKKSLGQHFLFDLNLTRKIARLASPLHVGTTIEIGPGPGGLTRGLLLEGATHLFLVEKDERCIHALEDIAQAARDRTIQICKSDALEVSLPDLTPTPRRIVANLPYNISVPLFIKWLTEIYHNPSAYESLTLMFQKEVAARIMAEPGSANYGRLSVISQWLICPQTSFEVPKQAFTPPPKVTSTVVRLAPRSSPAYPAKLKDLEAVTAAAFGKRRKMIRQSLKSLGWDIPSILEEVGLKGTERAEELSVQTYCALARCLGKKS